MGITISGATGIDMGDKPISNASQVEVQENQVSPFSGFKNYIINGGFDIWQRGTSQTLSGYGSDDRWNNINSVSTKTHSYQASSDTERALFNACGFSRTVVTSVVGATSYCYKQQKIEDVVRLAGKTVTLSFWAKADSNKNIAIDFRQNFGTGGTPSTTVTNIGLQSIPLTTTWQKKSITIQIPSIVGKTLGTDGLNTSFTYFNFWFDTGNIHPEVNALIGNQSGIFDIAQVQLEEGSVATPFENRPIGLELSLCQRYYEHNLFKHYIPNSGVSTILISIPYKVTKRVAASLTYSSVGIYGGYNPPVDNDSVNNENGFNVARNADELNFHWYASAEL